jgi:hypothetical protein
VNLTQGETTEGLARWAAKREPRLDSCPLCAQEVPDEAAFWPPRATNLEGAVAQGRGGLDRDQLGATRLGSTLADNRRERSRLIAAHTAALSATDPLVAQVEAAREELAEARRLAAEARGGLDKLQTALAWVQAHYDMEVALVAARLRVSRARNALAETIQAQGQRQALRNATGRARDAQARAQDQLQRVDALSGDLGRAISELVAGRVGGLERRVSAVLPVGLRFGLELGKGRAGVRFGLRQPDGRLRGHTALYGAELLCLELALALALAPPTPWCLLLLQDGQERAIQGEHLERLCATLAGLPAVERTRQIVLVGLAPLRSAGPLFASTTAFWRSIDLTQVVVGPPRARAEEAAAKSAGSALAEAPPPPPAAPKRTRKPSKAAGPDHEIPPGLTTQMNLD